MAKKWRKEQSDPSGDGNPPKRKISKAEAVGVVQEVLLSELKLHGEGTIELVHKKCDFPKEAGHLIGIAVNALCRAKKSFALISVIHGDGRHTGDSSAFGVWHKPPRLSSGTTANRPGLGFLSNRQAGRPATTKATT